MMSPSSRWRRFLDGLSSIPGERTLQHWLLVTAATLIVSWLVLAGLVLWELSVHPVPPGESIGYDVIPYFSLLRTTMHVTLTGLGVWLGVLARGHREGIRSVQGLKWRWILAPLMVSVMMAMYTPWIAWATIVVVVLFVATIRRYPAAQRVRTVEGGSFG